MQVLADIIFTSVFSRMVGGTRLNQYWIENIEEQWTIGIDMILSMTSSIILTGWFICECIFKDNNIWFMPVHLFRPYDYHVMMA